MKEGERAHRAVINFLLGEMNPAHRAMANLPAMIQGDMHVHHMDFDKANCMPENLVYCPLAFNPSPLRRCPYTGQHMNVVEWTKLYGRAAAEAAPSWVTEEVA